MQPFHHYKAVEDSVKETPLDIDIDVGPVAVEEDRYTD